MLPGKLLPGLLAIIPKLPGRALGLKAMDLPMFLGFWLFSQGSCCTSSHKAPGLLHIYRELGIRPRLSIPPIASIHVYPSYVIRPCLSLRWHPFPPGIFFYPFVLARDLLLSVPARSISVSQTMSRWEDRTIDLFRTSSPLGHSICWLSIVKAFPVTH